MVVMGPLSRLRLFGFLCPCHESDDEYNARMGAAALEFLRIQWYRTVEGRVISLDATLRIYETKTEGPCLKITCEEYHVSDFTTNILTIPFKDIDKVELVDTEYRCEIQVYGKNELLLQFHVHSPQEVLFHLIAVLWWDQERRAELEEKLGRLQAAERLQEEQKRLCDDARIQLV
jgi:hypothetical protein